MSFPFKKQGHGAMLKQDSQFRDRGSILVSAVLTLLFIALLAFQVATVLGRASGPWRRGRDLPVDPRSRITI